VDDGEAEIGAARNPPAAHVVLAHELRSPLNIILGYTDLLLDDTFGTLSAEQREPLECIDRASRQLLDHINEAIEFGRLEAGRSVIEPEEMTVEALFWQIEIEARPLIEQRVSEVRVNFTAPSDLPPLYTDCEKLKVVLKNLLVNALKFTASGIVDIGAVARDCGVEFSVRDTGVGIPKAELDTIFEPFTQVAGTPTKGAKGVGLGLNIAKRFVALLGGSIAVVSEPGRGSTFRVWLPFAGVRQAAAVA